MFTGAALDALGLLALKAPFGLFYGHFGGVAQGDLLEVMVAERWGPAPAWESWSKSYSP